MLISRLGEQNLPNLEFPGTKGGGAGKQVIPPDPAEALRAAPAQFGPGFLEIGAPSHQSAVIIRPKIMPIFHHKKQYLLYELTEWSEKDVPSLISIKIFFITGKFFTISDILQVVPKITTNNFVEHHFS